MSFIRNIWYVAAWSHEVADAPVGRQIIGQPIVLWRRSDGRCVAMENRCPHRQALLSLGRVEDGRLRCMYHGLRFDQTGQCIEVPGSDRIPPNSTVTTYPIEERDSWIWVWLGDPALADPKLIPAAFGNDGQWKQTKGAVIDYEADYTLVNDNLTDLTHINYTHEKSIAAMTGGRWTERQAQVDILDNGLHITRWMTNHPELAIRPDGPPGETFQSYHYLLPGLFLMRTRSYPPGTGEKVNFGDPGDVPYFFDLVDQQAITPVAEGRSRYFYSSGVPHAAATPEMLEGTSNLLNQAFEEDRSMIEAQQQNWNLIGSDRAMAFIPQDKAPYLFRRMLAQRIEDEQAAAASKADTKQKVDA